MGLTFTLMSTGAESVLFMFMFMKITKLVWKMAGKDDNSCDRYRKSLFSKLSKVLTCLCLTVLEGFPVPKAIFL